MLNFIVFTCSSIVLADDIDLFMQMYQSDEARQRALKAIEQFVPYEKAMYGAEKKLLATKKKKLNRFRVSFLSSRKISNELNDLVNIRAGSYYNEKALKTQFKEIDDYLKEKGFVENQFELKISNETEDSLDAQIFIKNEKNYRITKVIEKFDRPNKEIKWFLNSLVGRGYSRSSLNVFIDSLYKELFFLGYFQAKVSLNPKSLDRASIDEGVEIIAEIELGQKLAFSFSGNESIEKQKIKEYLKIALPKSQSAINRDSLKQAVKDFYREYGFYSAEIDVQEFAFAEEGIASKNYYISINEGERKKISKINFIGNRLVKADELKEVFFKEGSSLIQSHFFDAKYFEQAVKVIKEFYHKKGFLFVNVSKQVREDLAEVDFIIRENNQILLDEIEVYNKNVIISPDLDSFNLVNKEGSPFNVTEVENDINKVIQLFRDQGYFYSEVERKEPSEIVVIDEIKNTAKLKIYLNLKEVYLHGKIFVFGPNVTDDIVIKREREVLEGEIVRQPHLQEFESRLRALNLFGHLRLEYFARKEGEKHFVDILVLADEKSFGAFQFAPGYRTGRGIKLDMSVTYNNIWKRNHQASLRTEVNQRLDVDQDYYNDANRNGTLLEYTIQALYTIPYIGPYPIRSDFSTSLTRRKFANFDADVETARMQATKSFGQHFNLSLNYQLESIRQFNATNAKDVGSFRIGSLTPALAVDFRDSTSSPRSGFYSALSYERAAPWAFSMNEDDLKVDFYSLISRSYFYYTLFDVTFAQYVSVGLQENLSTQRLLANGSLANDYIPTIKVFRLAGEDIIRGFDDNEANRVYARGRELNGKDIADLKIDDRAYFFNFKFEPRFRVGEDFIVAPFYDMGRVFVKDFDFSKLRSAVGMSFKYITPVGTLDFDYGIKIKRQGIDEKRESVGRFHLNIGTF